MKLKYTILLALFLSLGAFTSCDDDDDDIDYTATYPISGDWVVTFNVETAPGQFEPLTDPTEVLIYNTAANIPTEVWIDDQGNFWNFIVRATTDMNALTFSAQNSVSIALQEDEEGELVPYDIEVNITDGQIFQNAVTVNAVPRDSIYFRVSFEDDATPFGTIYHVYGHRKSGFEFQ